MSSTRAQDAQCRVFNSQLHLPRAHSAGKACCDQVFVSSVYCVFSDFLSHDAPRSRTCSSR